MGKVKLAELEKQAVDRVTENPDQSWYFITEQERDALCRAVRAAKEIRDCPLSANEDIKPIVLEIHCALERYQKFKEALAAFEWE